MKTPAASTTDTVANNKTFSCFVSSMTAKEETKKDINKSVHLSPSCMLNKLNLNNKIATHSHVRSHILYKHLLNCCSDVHT